MSSSRGVAISVDDLMQHTDRYLGRKVRLLKLSEVRSPRNPDGFVMPRLRLRRQTAEDSVVPTYGEQALSEDATYTFGGADERTLVFIDDATNDAKQIFRNELPGACFVVLPSS